MLGYTNVLQFNQKNTTFMKILSYHLALRYLTYHHENASIKQMIRMCFAGITIGSCALMLTLMIMHGFESVISEKIQGISAPITISSPAGTLDAQALTQVLRTEFSEHICGSSASSIKQIIVDHNQQQTIVFVRGINPTDEAGVTSLPTKIIAPLIPAPNKASSHFVGLLPHGSMIIGYKLARTLGLSIGSVLTVLVPEPRSKKSLALVSKTVTISGFFNVGLEEYDSSMAFVNISTLHKWFDDAGTDQITIALVDRSGGAAEHCLALLKKRLPGLSITTWQEQYPALVASLKLEKYVMFLVLALITLVACMNMISLLFMQIQHKRRDVALLRTLGMPSKSLQAIFMIMGMLITTAASIAGLSIAAGIGYILEHVWQLPLPDVYYISYVPICMQPHLFIIVFSCTMLLGLLATWLPLRNVQKIKVVEVLRNS
jgi:lipoprotein-releasing system permease protein